MHDAASKFFNPVSNSYEKIETIPNTSHPNSRKTSTASIEDFPVEIKSSTTTTFIPSLTNPSTWFLRPCFLADERTYPIGKSNLSAIIAA